MTYKPSASDIRLKKKMKSYVVHIQGVEKSHDDAWKAAIKKKTQ